MKTIWQRIEMWLKQYTPDILADLREGASDADLKKAAQVLSCVLPDDMTESYRIHDGTRGSASLLGEWELLSLDGIVKEWKILKKLYDDGTFEGLEGDAGVGIQSDWWNPRWIPVGGNGSGDFLCVDLNPPPAGTSGQIISFFHAEPRRELVAKGFKFWLAEFADDLESGKYELENGRRLTKRE